MSTLYLGTDPENLAVKLAGLIDAGRREGDFFLPVTVVVPNRYLAKWLRLWLARHHGVAINLKVLLRLEETMWDMLRASDAREHPAPLGLIDDDHYRLMILAELLEEEGEGAPMAPLREFLGGMAEGCRRDYWRRAWHLSGQLSSLLRDYEYHRQDILIQKWLMDEDGYPHWEEGGLRLERSQRELFRRITAEPDGLRARLGRAAGKLCKTLPQYANEIMEPNLPRPPGRLPVVHIFGLNQISALHVRTLRWLGRQYDLRVYRLSPLLGQGKAPSAPAAACKHLLGLADSLQGSSKDQSTKEPENELLAAWGRAGAEGLRLMAELLDGKAPFRLEIIENPTTLAQATEARASGRRASAITKASALADTVLTRLQQHLTGRATSEKPLLQDATLQIVACPGVYREVETAHNSILDNLRRDPTLKQTDIAVLATDMALYRPAIQGVFEREPRHIFYNLSDSSAAELSVFGHAVLGLLDLALESFSRSRVFQVLLSPCFLACLDVGRDQGLLWLEWAEKLGIYHGWDPSDKRERGYPDSSLYSWQLGLRRLRLGRLMEAPRDGGPAPCFEGVIPFATLESGNKDQLDVFCRAIEELLPRLLHLRRLSATGAIWAGELRRLVDDFLAVPPDRPGEAQVRDALFRALDDLKLLDALAASAQPHGAGCGKLPHGLPLALVRELVQDRLETLRATTGEPLTGGVTVSGLQALMPVPFRIVYVLGLGEGLFPGSNTPPAFDLRSRERRPGDIWPAEGNRFLLLQALLAARSKVYLLYSSRELQKDQALYPCSCLSQLVRFLEERVLAEKKLEIADVPLRGSHSRCLGSPDVAPFFDVFGTYSETERLVAIEDALKDKTLSLDERSRREVERRLKKARITFELPAPSAAAATGGKKRRVEVATITLGELRGFLRCPAEAVLKRHLGLRDEDEPELLDDEPFFTGYPHNYRLVTEALSDFVGEAVRWDVPAALKAWRQRFRALHNEYRLRGRAPEDAFGEADLARFEELLECRIEGARGIAAFVHARAGSSFHGPMLLGESFDPVGARLSFPALGLKLAEDGSLTEARLVGKLPFIWAGPDTVDILLLTNTAKAKVQEQHLCLPLLEPLLFALALKASAEPGADGESAGAWLAERAVHIHVAHGGGLAEYKYGPQDVTAAEARTYLQELTGDFLKRDALDLIPFDLVVATESLRAGYLPSEEQAEPLPPPDVYVEMLLEALDDDQEQGKQHPKYRAMKLLEIATPDVPPDALDKVQKRFRLLDRGPAHTRHREKRGARDHD